MSLKEFAEDILILTLSLILFCGIVGGIFFLTLLVF